MANPQATTGSLGLSCECSTKSYAYLDNLEWNDIADLDLLATVFSLTIQEETAFQQAEKVLQSVGTLSRLAQVPARELHNLIPKSPHTVALINLMRLGMHRIVNERTSDQIRIGSPATLAEYVAIHRNPTAGGSRRIILLDRDSRLIRDLSISLSETDIKTCRNVAQEALKADAFGLIVIDYIYKDDLQFSSKLNSLYELIAAAMININVNFYDYLIVGINRFYSKNRKSIVKLYEA